MSKASGAGGKGDGQLQRAEKRWSSLVFLFFVANLPYVDTDAPGSCKYRNPFNAPQCHLKKNVISVLGICLRSTIHMLQF
jgi:hypothetical protein